MKIAFFVRSMSNGGAEKVAAQLTRIWAQLGHETVLLMELPPSSCGEYACECAAREFVGGDAAIVSQRLMELHAKCHFDVAVFNDAINSDWFATTFATAKGLGLRTIVINHHTANNWMYGCCNTKELFLDDVLSKVDAMVCVDRMWALWWKYRGVRSVFMQNPVSIENCGRVGELKVVGAVDEAVEALKGRRNILWIGRICDALKCPELAIEVFVELSKMDSTARMVMLGHCDTSTKRRLLCNVLTGTRERIAFPGFVTNVGDYLAKADMLLFTSATEVAVPQVVLEAMAAGIPTVAFDQPVLRGSLGSQLPIGGGAEKWQRVLTGAEVECDFDTPEVRQNLMDELHRSQQWFATHYLPELLTWRRWKTRMSARYLWRRLLKRIGFHD